MCSENIEYFEIIECFGCFEHFDIKLQIAVKHVNENLHNVYLTNNRLHSVDMERQVNQLNLLFAILSECSINILAFNTENIFY